MNNEEKECKKEILDNTLLHLRKQMLGINYGLYEDKIPLKLTLELYKDEDDFNHLNYEDYIRIKNAPKRINAYNLFPYSFTKEAWISFFKCCPECSPKNSDKSKLNNISINISFS